jgi:hypothetical protein
MRAVAHVCHANHSTHLPPGEDGKRYDALVRNALRIASRRRWSEDGLDDVDDIARWAATWAAFFVSSRPDSDAESR